MLIRTPFRFIMLHGHKIVRLGGSSQESLGRLLLEVLSDGSSYHSIILERL